MTQKTEEAIKIAEKIQKDIVDDEVSTQNILRQYYHLVTLIEKADEIEWATNELFGYKDEEKVPNYRKPRNDQGVIASINNDCGTIQAWLLNGDSFVYSVPLPVSAKNSNIYSHHIKSDVHVGPETFFYILNTIKTITYFITQQILLEIKFGKFEFDIFEETRKVVDAELKKRCPEVFKTLTKAYEDLMKSETPQDYREIALACRTVLKDFADVIYPASNKEIIGFDGKSHTLKDDDFTNRIIACIQESISSESDKEFMKDFMEDNLRYLESYLASIKIIVNRGVHNEKSREYANRCLIYTYLALGDVIKLLGKQ